MLPTQELIKEILLRDQLITPEDLNRAIKEQEWSGGELSRILLRLKLVAEDQLSVVLSEALQLPLINLNLFRIDPSLLKLIPKETAEKSLLIPISKLNDQLTIAMVDPLDMLTVDNIKAMTSMSVSVVLARPKEMRAALERNYGQTNSSDLEEIFQDIKDTKEAESLELVKEHSHPNQRAIESLSEEAPIITLTNTIIQQAVVAKASDVFIEPMENCLRIRYRVDGFIREIDRMSKTLHFPLISRIKVISSLDIAEHRLPQDGRFRIVTDKNLEVDFRVNVLPTAMGEKIVLRVLDKNQDMADIDKLGFEPDSLERLKDCCHRPHGMILACGPTGSGKTTTLYAILKYIDSPGRNIVTVEDPVEFQMKGFNQVNIRTEFGLSFPAALRSILRQDPDVILIGEIRDSETLDIAVKAALTGHLVVSSLHTTTGPGSITRMINMGVEPFLITSSVVAIVAQRLVRRVCQKCRELYTATDEIIQEFHLKKLLPNHNGQFYRPKGCDKCLKTGYKGRVGITETLVLNNKIKELILLSSSEADIKNEARAHGMTTMREDAVIKASQGLTTLEEVIRLTAPDSMGLIPATHSDSELMDTTQERILKTLKEMPNINPADIDALIEVQQDKNISLVKALLKQRIISEQDLLILLMRELHIPSIDLTKYRFDERLKSILGEKSARQYQVMPISLLGATLTVAIADPLNVFVLDDLRNVTGKEIEIVLASESQIVGVIDHFYRADSVSMAHGNLHTQANGFEILQGKDGQKDALPEQNDLSSTEEGPVIRIVNLVIKEALRQRASDIHIEPQELGMRVRFRIDGILQDILTIPKESKNAVGVRIKLMANLDITNTQTPQDGRFKMKVGKQEVDFRVSMLPTTFGQKIVMRVLDKNNLSVGLSKLGFSKNATTVLEESIYKPYGMILVTGPTGSGKSTTLYSLISKLNTPDRNIITIEEPVEYLVDGLTQIEVKPDIGLNFATGLRAVLRQSPDIVMVGEIRDAETADIAIKASLTGQLVLSTLHTNSAAGAVTRLIDMGLEPFLVASSLVLVCAQRLCRRICDSCKRPMDIKPEMLQKIQHRIKPDTVLYEGKGCERCRGTGYKGRVGVTEVLLIDDDIRRMLLSKSTSMDITRYAQKNQGMKLLFDDVVDKMCAGETSLAEVFRVASEDE